MVPRDDRSRTAWKRQLQEHLGWLGAAILEAIDAPVLSVSWSFEDHSVNIKALRKGLIEHEASDTGGVLRWQSSCPDRLAEATAPNLAGTSTTTNFRWKTCSSFRQEKMKKMKKLYEYVPPRKRASAFESKAAYQV